MKRFVNGVETDLDPEAAVIVQTSDRLNVKTAGGSYSALAVRQGDKTLISFKGRQYTVEKAIRTHSRHGGAGSGEIHAPMPGLIVDVLVAAGDAVAKGVKLVVLEAMKTQQAFTAAFDGIVESVAVEKGAQVVEGQLLVKVKPIET